MQLRRPDPGLSQVGDANLRTLARSVYGWTHCQPDHAMINLPDAERARNQRTTNIVVGDLTPIGGGLGRETNRTGAFDSGKLSALISCNLKARANSAE